MVKVDSELQTKVVRAYGDEIQSTICMEECAELIQAISKMKRSCKNNKCDISELQNYRSNLIEEMVDVYIILEQLKVIYKVSNEELEMWLDKKQARQRKNL